MGVTFGKEFPIFAAFSRYFLFLRRSPHLGKVSKYNLNKMAHFAVGDIFCVDLEVVDMESQCSTVEC